MASAIGALAERLASQALAMTAGLAGLVAVSIISCATWASAEQPWMSEAAMRAEFVGKVLEGYFRQGGTWKGSYHKEGRFDGCEGALCAPGRWYIRDGWFCLLDGPPHWGLSERCGAVIKVGSNCYEFHRVDPDRSSPTQKEARPELVWHSRGWRKGEPPTCEERPTA